MNYKFDHIDRQFGHHSVGLGSKFMNFIRNLICSSNSVKESDLVNFN